MSVTILTKDCQVTLPKVLASVQEFDEVVVYDTGSEDQTVSIAETFPNVTVHRGELVGFGPTHNLASAAAKNDWILSIDSDEVVTPEMKQEIFSTSLNPQTVYTFPRDNYFNGKRIKWCGWYPDRHVRLYHRQNTRFTDAQVHERIISENMNLVDMKSALTHYSYKDTADFLCKMQHYSDLFAEQNQGKKSSSTCKAVVHALYAFLKSYFIKRGFLGGYEGFVISVYNANTAFYKYIKLRELNAKLQR